ncbi:hypothetical protein HN873_006143 [Arachis hypogaea]
MVLLLLYEQYSIIATNTGESETFWQKAIEQQGPATIMDTIEQVTNCIGKFNISRFIFFWNL